MQEHSTPPASPANHTAPTHLVNSTRSHRVAPSLPAIKQATESAEFGSIELSSRRRHGSSVEDDGHGGVSSRRAAHMDSYALDELDDEAGDLAGRDLVRSRENLSGRVPRVSALPSPFDIQSAADAIDQVQRAESIDRTKEKPGPYVLHPHSLVRQRWDMCTVIIIAYSAVWIPFDVAFNVEPPLWLVWFNYALDAFFWVDIGLNFRTGIEIEDHKFRFGPMEIARAYLKGWFWIDLLAAFPYEAIINDDQKERLPKMLRVLRLSKLLRLIRLVRIVRIVRVIQRLEYSMHLQEGVRQLASFLVVLITITHWFSCLFYSLGDFDRIKTDDGEHCWANGYHLCSDDNFTNYVAACYWAIMTLTTVGYGDVSAQNNQQRVLGIIAMICGALIFAYGVSQIVNIVEDMRAESKSFKTRMDKFNSYMAHRNLPHDLRGDIREFLHNIRRRQRSTIKDEDYLLAQLSMGLRSRIAMAINEQYLKEMPFFLGADVELTMELALRMESYYYAAYEDVIRAGEEGDEMFFIVAGACEVLVGSTETRVAVLVEKQFFGESALLMPEGQRKRTATVRCLQFCEFRSLRTDHFLDILAKFPKARQQIEQLSATRQAVLKAKEKAAEDLTPGRKPDALEKQFSSNKLASTFKAFEAADSKDKTLMNSLAEIDPKNLESHIGGEQMVERQNNVALSPGGAVAARDEAPASGPALPKSPAVIQRVNTLPPGLVARLESIERSQHDTARRLLDIQDYILNKGNVGTAAHIHDRKPIL